MPTFIVKQSTATSIETPAFLSPTDLSELTALTKQTGRVVRAGVSAAFTPDSWAHNSNGCYKIGLTTTDTADTGEFEIKFESASTYLPVAFTVRVLSEARYNYEFGDAAPNTTKTGYSLAGTQTFDMTGNITGNLSGSVGSVTGSVGSVTGNVGGNVAGSVGSVTGAVGSVTAAVTLAAEQEFNNTGQTTNLPANVKAVNGEDIEVVTEFDANVTKVLDTALTETTEGRLAGNLSTFFDNGDADTEKTVDDVGSGGNAPTASQIADAVWDEAQSGHTTTGTFGKFLDAAVSGVSTGGVSAADIADAVWDEALSGHTTAGTAGKAAANLDAAVSTRSTYAGTDTPGTTTLLSRLTATRASNLDNLDGKVSDCLQASGYTAPDNSSITAIKAKTDNLPASPAATGDIPSASTIATQVDTTLSASHGDGSWETATGFSTFDPDKDTVAHVTLVDTCTTNTDMRGTDNAYTGTPPTTSQIAAQLLTTPANKLATDTNGRVSLAAGAITSDTFTVEDLDGPATGLVEQIFQLWRRFFGPSQKTGTAIQTLDDDGNVVTSQAYDVDSDGTETVGGAS